MGQIVEEIAEICLENALPYPVKDYTSHQSFDLELYFKEADEQDRKDCTAICKNIEALLSRWLGERQLKYLILYLGQDLSSENYRSNINKLTFLFKDLAEASLARQMIYG